jgi:hypothetical protein
MMPGFCLHTTNVFALEDGFQPVFYRRTQWWVGDGAITAVCEFTVVTFTAIGAGYSNHVLFSPM